MKKTVTVLLMAVLIFSCTAVLANPENDAIVFKPYMFDDMEGGEFYYSSVEYAMNKGIMSGMGDNKFAPNATISKVQLVSMLWNLSNQPGAPLLDELGNTWYQGAVSWGKETGVYPYDIASLHQPLTRGEISEMIYLYAKYRNFDTDTSGDLQKFWDASSLEQSKYEAMNWMVEKGIMSGYPDGSLGADNSATRGECAVMIHRFCEESMGGELSDFPIYVDVNTLSATVMDTQLGNFWLKVGDISASAGIDKIIAVTWCADDQSDMSWYQLEPRDDGSYGVLVQAKDHGFHFGNYTIDIYVHLNNGTKLCAGSTSFWLDGDESQARVWTQVHKVYQQVGWDLYACYNWVVRNVSYKKLPIPLIPPAGYDAAEWYSIQAFENRAGNCYCYAAAFYYLAKGLGYDARFIQGQVGLAAGGYGPHGWVIINMNGASYICDPESQHSVGRYNFYMQPVGSPVFRYRWE